MPKLTRRKFTKEFKQEAVQLLEKDERAGGDIARELGVSRAMLYRWRRELGLNAGAISSVSELLSADEREELKRLRKENARLREDKEILKKATAFFAKESK